MNNKKTKISLDRSVKLSTAWLLVSVYFSVMQIPGNIFMLTFSIIFLAISIFLQTFLIIPKQEPDWTLCFPELGGIDESIENLDNSSEESISLFNDILILIDDNQKTEYKQIDKNDIETTDKVIYEFPRINGFQLFAHISWGLTKIIFIMTIPFLIYNWPNSDILIVTSCILIAIGFFIRATEIPHESYCWELVYPELLEFGNKKINGSRYLCYISKIVFALFTILTFWFLSINHQFNGAIFIIGITSAILFFIINAFNLPNKKLNWCKVYPELNL